MSGKPTPTVLTKDVWTLVLSDVINKGKIHVIEQDNEPTEYLVTYVDTGDPAPDVNYIGGEVFSDTVIFDNDAAMDVYVKPVNNDGLLGVVS